ncbi:MAG: hypothetical protein JO174_17270 [Herbaspirillum sp.]|nr:hypothetical protein [Herbaspirillum sp.]
MKNKTVKNPLVSAQWILRISMATVVILLIWAAVSHIDQVTRAQGERRAGLADYRGCGRACR